MDDAQEYEVVTFGVPIEDAVRDLILTTIDEAVTEGCEIHQTTVTAQHHHFAIDLPCGYVAERCEATVEKAMAGAASEYLAHQALHMLHPSDDDLADLFIARVPP